MQIIQFLVGVSYATLHSFVSYDIPVQVPDVQSSVKGAASAASTALSAVATSSGPAGIGALIKKILLRAAGEEGLAENVGGYAAEQTVSSPSASTAWNHHTEYRTVPCIDTSGQTFAIWLNVFYLTPLTVLFVRFFIKSYIRRTSGKGTSHSTKHVAAEKARKDAVKGIERDIYQNGTANGNGYANAYVNGKMNGKH